MAVATAMVAPAGFRARNADIIQSTRSAFALRILVGYHERGFLPAQDRSPEAVARTFDTHKGINA